MEKVGGKKKGSGKKDGRTGYKAEKGSLRKT